MSVEFTEGEGMKPNLSHLLPDIAHVPSLCMNVFPA